MKKDPAVFLGHILDSIELIESYSRGKTELDLMNSVGLQDKIIRRIEIIGEAVKNLPADLRKDHPEVPWRDMAGGNRGFSRAEGEDLEDPRSAWQRGQVNGREPAGSLFP